MRRLLRPPTRAYRGLLGSALRTFPASSEVLSFVLRFLAEKLECKGTHEPSDVAISPYYQRAVDALYDAMTPVDLCGRTELPVVPKGPAGARSTAQVDFWSGRDLWPANKCHLNAMVADTSKWEQSAAFVLDANERVSRWAKNDHLGLRMPYRKGGLALGYFPDFVAVLDSGLNLVIEVKGLTGDDARIKKTAAERWVQAVNASGRYGRWAYEMVSHPADVGSAIGRVRESSAHPGSPVPD
jgi:type III restriction enzyme